MIGIARWIIALLAIVLLIDFGSSTTVSVQDWNSYKMKYNKVYESAVAEANAKFYYGYNRNWINSHNSQYDRGQKTFKLKTNQFSDMRLIHFNALFPVATPLKLSYSSPPPPTKTPPSSYDPAKNFNYMFRVENQGTKCNSGWSYAAVKAIEIFQAQQMGNLRPAPLSAQNIIDCAGRSIGCQKQVPQTAYDYLTQYSMDLHVESDYVNRNTLDEPGMCVPKGNIVTKLAKYSVLNNGDDASLQKYVGSGMPVVVEFNPTSFEFMHYAEGVYQQPRNVNRGSHYMVVVGYGTDPTTGMDYWILQNSFSTTWGESGLIRVQRSPTVKLTTNAIFPSELA